MISLISLGGTISMSNNGNGALPALNASDLTKSFSRIKAITHSNISSPNVSFTMLLEVLKLAKEEIKSGQKAVIITQGTDTLEESAFFLNLFWDFDEPLIFTGAMKNQSELGSDSLANINDAIILANSDKSRALGVLCVLNSSIHHANHIHKSNTFSLETFTSFNRGLVGQISEGEFCLFNTNFYRPFLKPCKITKKVAIIKQYLDFDDELLSLALDSFDGVVISGYGAGHVMAKSMPIIKNTSKKIIMSSRCESGKTGTKSYAYAGAEIDLANNGVIMSKYLSDLKARILLALCLSQDFDVEKIQKLINNFV